MVRRFCKVRSSKIKLFKVSITIKHVKRVDYSKSTSTVALTSSSIRNVWAAMSFLVMETGGSAMVIGDKSEYISSIFTNAPTFLRDHAT